MLALALLVGLPQDHPALPAGPEDEGVTRPLLPKRDCTSKGDEVVICANTDPSRYRYKPLDPGRFVEAPVRARMNLLGGEASADAVQRSVGNVSVPSLMFTFRLPLGRKVKKADE
jgi:hypothetical protein